MTDQRVDDKSETSTYLVEYQTLRDETLELEQLKHGLDAITYSITAAIFAFSFGSSNFYLLLIIYAVIIPLKCRHIYLHELEMKIGIYIKVFIEPELQGLRWEGLCHEKEVEQRNSSQLIKYHWLSNYTDFSIGMTVSIFLLVNMYNMADNISLALSSSWWSIVAFLASIGFTVFLGKIDTSMIKGLDAVIIYYEQNWKDLKAKQ